MNNGYYHQNGPPPPQPAYGGGGFNQQQPQYAQYGNGYGMQQSQPYAQQYDPQKNGKMGGQQYGNQAEMLDNVKPKWNDVIFALLFLAQFGAFVAVSVLSLRALGKNGAGNGLGSGSGTSLTLNTCALLPPCAKTTAASLTQSMT